MEIYRGSHTDIHTYVHDHPPPFEIISFLFFPGCISLPYTPYFSRSIHYRHFPPPSLALRARAGSGARPVYSEYDQKNTAGADGVACFVTSKGGVSILSHIQSVSFVG